MRPLVLYDLLHGKMEDVLPGIPDCTFDSCVTDPPYELGFMGKSWDSTGVAFRPETWRHVLRVLKPGAHLLAFGGSRTYHRIACAIEDAGFEVRDQIMWLYGSGFPKSLDVSKAIDRANGNPLAWIEFAQAYGEAVSASSLTHADIDRELGIKSSSCYWARLDHRGGMPPRAHWDHVSTMLCLSSKFTDLYDSAEREIIGQKKSGISDPSESKRYTIGASSSIVVDITAPATDAACEWDGWGTALKPAHEPIVVARRPLDGTVAANVMRWGTGAVNIDGCRVPSECATGWAGGAAGGNTWNAANSGLCKSGEARPVEGRWPANIIHDGSDEVLAAFPSAPGALVAVTGDEPSSKTNNVYNDFGGRPATTPRGDAGSAARFFQTCKFDDDELLFCRAKSILKAWNPELASTVDCLSSLPKLAVDSALSLAAIAASRGDRVLKDLIIHFMIVTPLELKILSESIIEMILFIEKNVSPEQQLEKLSLNGSLVRFAEAQKGSGIITTTISLSKSNGFAVAVTFNIMPQSLVHGDQGLEAGRFKYCAKASRADRDEGCEHLGLTVADQQHAIPRSEMDDPRRAGTVPRANSHPTVKPTALMRYLLRLVTPPGGITVDPFFGSGSTGKAAIAEGFSVVGITDEAEHVAIARARLDHAMREAGHL